MDLKEIDILGDKIKSHWYYLSKANAVAQILRQVKMSKILDVGAGSGYFSKNLLSRSDAAEAWCVDISYEKDSDIMEAGKIIRFRKTIETVDADLVLFMDVLEHVDNDVDLLKQYIAKVPKGTHFLISVPAFSFLWSEHDVFLDHKRRYLLRQIEAVAESAGLKVKSSSYYFGAVFPIAALLRVVGNIFRTRKRQPRSHLTAHQPLVNDLLAALSRAELPLLPYNRLAGLTAFCLAAS